LSTVYLVRHGQAGTRDAYDSLSQLGKIQARRLGEHFLSQRIDFASACSGTLLRQRETGEEVRAAYTRAGVRFPTIKVVPEWNEFDLAQVYREMAPLLCAADDQFRVEYEKMLEQVRNSNGEPGATIHRKWLPCDTKIVNAWTSGRYPYSGETWDQFRERIASRRFSTGDAAGRENVVVFTSATPVAIWTGLSLQIPDEGVMLLAGVLYNASYTVLRLREGQLRLFTFNAAPHLSSDGVRTHR
jgi:broad specificity phosphatase PhoE